MFLRSPRDRRFLMIFLENRSDSRLTGHISHIGIDWRERSIEEKGGTSAGTCNLSLKRCPEERATPFNDGVPSLPGRSSLSLRWDAASFCFYRSIHLKQPQDHSVSSPFSTYLEEGKGKKKRKKKITRRYRREEGNGRRREWKGRRQRVGNGSV